MMLKKMKYFIKILMNKSFNYDKIYLIHNIIYIHLNMRKQLRFIIIKKSQKLHKSIKLQIVLIV